MREETCEQSPHRCAVCWVEMKNHAEWYQHATDEHGAELDQFGYHRPGGKGNCPGEGSVRRLKGYGIQRQPACQRIDNSQAVTGWDGTAYTPQPLPWEAA